MTIDNFKDVITYWSTWAQKDSEERFDIALFKIWMQMELFISDLFISYCTGNTSEKGYLPSLKLQFLSEEHLNVFLREGSKSYVEYFVKIEKLSKHIFTIDPFDVIFGVSDNKTVYNQVRAIRNLVAHESGEAKSKYVNFCFSGDLSKYVEPQIYLLKKEPTSKKTYYSYYTEKLYDIADLLISPPA